VRDSIASMREENWFFHLFNQGELEILIPLFHLAHCSPGKTLVEEGAPAGGPFSIIISGSLEVKKKTDFGGSVILARITRGALLGYSSVYNRTRPFPIAVVALENSEFLQASAEEIAGLIERHPAIGIKILAEIVRIQDIRLEELLERFTATL
jgi:CRP-like cAMP-binding protein